MNTETLFPPGGGGPASEIRKTRLPVAPWLQSGFRTRREWDEHESKRDPVK